MKNKDLCFRFKKYYFTQSKFNFWTECHCSIKWPGEVFSFDLDTSVRGREYSVRTQSDNTQHILKFKKF